MRWLVVLTVLFAGSSARAGEAVDYFTTRSLELALWTEAAGAAAIREIQLYYTTDAGQTWVAHPETQTTTTAVSRESSSAAGVRWPKPARSEPMPRRDISASMCARSAGGTSREPVPARPTTREAGRRVRPWVGAGRRFPARGRGRRRSARPRRADPRRCPALPRRLRARSS